MLVNNLGALQAKHYGRGFSLLELMVVLAVIAVLASLALPSYDRYIMRAATDSARAQMLDTQRLLEVFKQKNVTYAGFDFTLYYTSGNRTATTVNVPLNGKEQYTITLGDAATGASLLLADSVSAPGWRMVAVPNTSIKTLQQAPYILVDSTGMRCTTTDTLTISSTNCGTKAIVW
jgi:type IV pilus assembly protein PilE